MSYKKKRNYLKVNIELKFKEMPPFIQINQVEFKNDDTWTFEQYYSNGVELCYEDTYELELIGNFEYVTPDKEYKIKKNIDIEFSGNNFIPNLEDKVFTFKVCNINDDCQKEAIEFINMCKPYLVENHTNLLAVFCDDFGIDKYNFLYTLEN